MRVMGRAASRHARRRGPRPSFESFPRAVRADRNEGHDATVREILPWHVVADDEEAAPISGISGVRGEAMNTVEGADPPLTYKVYTVAELDRRDSETPVSASIEEDDDPPALAAWLAVGKDAFRIALAVKTWALLGAGRPAFADALRAPTVVLKSDLDVADKILSWKRIVGVAVGAVSVAAILLFAVLTVADLTDDMRATSASTQAKAMAATPPPAATDAPPVVEDPAPAAAAAPQPVVDLDPPPAPAPHGKAAAKKKPAPKPVEVFIP